MSDRKLVYKVTIDEIEPMDADTLEAARIGGWRVVCKKGDFHAGDTALYFEIDAALNCHDDRFEFLKERCYKKFNSHGKLFDECIRIRTMKLRGVVSQGLLMKPELFCEVRNKKLGEDCSDVLMVRHYDEVAEKAAYECQPLRAANQKGSFPSWAPKTDEERVQNLDDETLTKYKGIRLEVTEKRDGCVEGPTPVLTNQGYIKINKIVTNKLPVQVLTYNEQTHMCEYKHILAYHSYKVNKPMVKVYITRKTTSAKTGRTTRIACTADHLFYTDRGWVAAGDLHKHDVIMRYSDICAPVVKEVLLGCALGDSGFGYYHPDTQDAYVYTMQFTHSEAQKDYLACKSRLLGNLWIDAGTCTSGYGSVVHRGHTVSNPYVNSMLNELCVVDGKKHITMAWMNAITPVSLAFWYMDDGYLHASDVQRPFCMLMTQRWSDAEVDMLISMLSRFGISATRSVCSHTHKDMIRIGAEEAQMFFSLIAPYVCPCMRYKLPEYWRNVPYVLDAYPAPNSSGLIATYVMADPEPYVPDNKHQTVYDLTIADNANYFAHDVLIHNSSMTIFYAPTRRQDDPMGVCSRNFELKDMPSSYWDAVHKYQLDEKLKAFCDKHGVELAIQGELTGPGIGGNRDNFEDLTFSVFRIWDIANQRWLTWEERYKVCEVLGLEHVPILGYTYITNFCSETGNPKDWTSREEWNPTLARDNILKYAEGKTARGNEREGVVFKSEHGTFTFKAVSNRYLLGMK